MLGEGQFDRVEDHANNLRLKQVEHRETFRKLGVRSHIPAQYPRQDLIETDFAHAALQGETRDKAQHRHKVAGLQVVDDVIRAQTCRNVLHLRRQALRLREIFVHQTHITLEILQQDALRHVVFHHQRHVLTVGDQRHAVAAEQVIERDHRRVEQLFQPGVGA